MRYAIREYACSAVDILARRTRLSFCNATAAEEALPRIVDIMAEELKWTEQQKKVINFSFKCLFCENREKQLCFIFTHNYSCFLVKTMIATKNL